MKKIFILFLMATTFIACQKEDENGDLGGFWKLLEIEETGAAPINVAEESRFWGIQLNLLEIRFSEDNAHYCRFQNAGDSLFVQTINDNTNLEAYGIYENSNERYAILHLSDRSMVLRSKYAKLTFRKF